MFREVEDAKCQLSDGDSARIFFDYLDQDIDEVITKIEFEAFIQPEINKIAKSLDETLAQAGVCAEDIDHVFLTGGTSKVPLVQTIFKNRFDTNKVKGGGNAFSSIAYGLGLMASRVF